MSKGRERDGRFVAFGGGLQQPASIIFRIILDKAITLCDNKIIEGNEGKEIEMNSYEIGKDIFDVMMGM